MIDAASNLFVVIIAMSRFRAMQSPAAAVGRGQTFGRPS